MRFERRWNLLDWFLLNFFQSKVFATNYKTHKLIVWILLICEAILILFLAFAQPIIFAIYSKFVFQFIIVSYCVNSILRLFFVSQFFLVSFSLQIKFKSLNENLKRLVSTREVQMVASRNSFTKDFGQTYQILCDAIDIVNETFTFPLALVLANVLVSFVLTTIGLM